MAIQAFKEEFEVDITGCEKEPVHIPGFIQAHGFIIGFSEAGVITRISENLLQKSGLTPNQVLGRTINEVPEELGELCRQSFMVRTPETSCLIEFSGQWLVARQVSVDRHLLVDLEPEVGVGTAGQGYQELAREDNQMHRAEIFQDAIHRFQTIQYTQATCDSLVESLRNLSHYDRVMVYRFEYDSSGVVIAEAKAEGLEPFLGLRYPASDIPAQVRELFRLNRCRVIGDRDSVPTPILSLPNLRPLDLSNSMLRGVSPVHIQYLVNMGVRASASFSLLINGELWGLVACHNYSEARYMSPAFRTKCDVLVSMASLSISAIENVTTFKNNEHWQNVLRRVLSTLESGVSTEETFTRFWSEICQLNQSSGLAMIHGGEVVAWGKTPGVTFIRRLGFWLDQKMTVQDIFHTSSLPAEWDVAEEYKEHASGILVLRLPVLGGWITTRAYLVWFRPELITTVTWAGNPEKAVVSDSRGLRLSPRASFEQWTQQVHLQSRRWTQMDIRATELFRDEYVKYCMRHQEEVIREGLRQNAIQQGKLELASRVLHDIGNIMSGIHTKVEFNRAKPAWVETAKLRQLGELIDQHLPALETVLGEGKGAMLQQFNQLLVQSLDDRESEVRGDFSALAHLVGEVEKILAVQRDFALGGGATRATTELVLADLVQQAVRLTLEKDEQHKIQCSVRIKWGILVRADETKLVRVFMNCVRFGIESMRAASLDTGVIEISAVVGAGAAEMSRYAVSVSISDDGAGLSEQVQRELSMVARDNTPRVSSLSYQILSTQAAVRSLGGSLRFDASSDGRVCIQTIIMPCAVELDVLHDSGTGDVDGPGRYSF